METLFGILVLTVVLFFCVGATLMNLNKDKNSAARKIY